METPEALEIVLKMARAHLAFTAEKFYFPDLADNFDMKSSDNRAFNTLEAEAIEEVELLSKSYKQLDDLALDNESYEASEIKK